VFGPEAAFTFFLEDQPLYRTAIGRVLAQGAAELVAGGPTRVGGGGDERYRNSVFVLDPVGELRGRYDKRHLLPFTEQFPLASSEFLRRRFERVHVFERGLATGPLPTRAGRAGVLVCNEAMLPEVARQRVREGAEYLVSPSNDTWIRDEKWASMMFDLVSVRAIEQRRWLVRASTSGPSAVVDPWGRVQVRTAAMTREVVLGSVLPRRKLSPYARVGDAFGIACAAAMAVALGARARRGSDGSVAASRSFSSRR
jgi:apolipoprotein N-acyltransferase